MNMNKIKPSIWCDLSIDNYKYKYPLLQVTDLCPECAKHQVQCVFFNHKKKIKYFYAYECNYFINTNKYQPDYSINAIRIYENEF